MELINEINQIKKMMGLNLINEAKVSWLDDLFTASKSLISTYVPNKDGLKKLINNGLEDASSDLKKRLSKDKLFGDNLITQLEAAKSKLKNTDTNRVLLDARIDEIKDLQKNLPTKPVTPKPKGLTLELDLDFRTSLSSDAKALFGKIGRKIDADELILLENAADKIYKGVQKLSDKELLILTQELNSFKINIQNAINNLSNAKDIKSQQKAKILQDKLNSIQKNWNSVVNNLDKVPLSKSLKVLVKYSLGLIVLGTLLGTAFYAKDTWLGRQVGALWSKIPTPELDNSTGNQGGSGNTGGKKTIDDY